MNPAKPPMEYPQILQQVTRLLGKHLDMAPVEIKPSDGITETLKMDSLSAVEFALALEGHFGMEIPDEAVEGAKTVEDIARRVEEMLLAQGRVADHVVKPPIDLNAIGPADGEPAPPPPCGICEEPATALFYDGFAEPDPRCEKHQLVAPQTQESRFDVLTVRSAGALLVDACHSASRSAGWWKAEGMDLCVEIKRASMLSGALVAQKLCLIHSEVSEAMEGHRKNLRDDKLKRRPMIEVELADAVIRICDLAGALGLDLGGAIEEKLAYNATRADHKPEARNASGGKRY